MAGFIVRATDFHLRKVRSVIRKDEIFQSSLKTEGDGLYLNRWQMRYKEPAPFNSGL